MMSKLSELLNIELMSTVLFAGEHNINWSEVPKPGKQVFYYDRSCEIKIIRLEV